MKYKCYVKNKGRNRTLDKGSTYDYTLQETNMLVPHLAKQEEKNSFHVNNRSK